MDAAKKAQRSAEAILAHAGDLSRTRPRRLFDHAEVPGIHALNFLLHEPLGGGGMASLRVDTLAKGYAQILLDFPVVVPEEWLRRYALG